MPLSGILGGCETRKKQFFHIFGAKKKTGKKSEIFFPGKIGIYRKKRRFFSDFFTSDFSFPKSFPTQQKTDFSPKNRQKKTIFLSLVVTDVFHRVCRLLGCVKVNSRVLT